LRKKKGRRGEKRVGRVGGIGGGDGTAPRCSLCNPARTWHKLRQGAQGEEAGHGDVEGVVKNNPRRLRSLREVVKMRRPRLFRWFSCPRKSLWILPSVHGVALPVHGVPTMQVDPRKPAHHSTVSQGVGGEGQGEEAVLAISAASATARAACGVRGRANARVALQCTQRRHGAAYACCAQMPGRAGAPRGAPSRARGGLVERPPTNGSRRGHRDRGARACGGGAFAPAASPGRSQKVPRAPEQPSVRRWKTPWRP